MIFFRIIIFFLVLAFATDTFAEKKLKFKKPKEYSKFSRINNAVFLPSKELTKPIPAVIILPSCDGIKKNSVASYNRWTKVFLENGYAVLTVDHYQKRGGQEYGCIWQKRKVTETQLVRDLHDAVEYLSTIPNIDKNRIFSIGFSLGAMTNGLAASQKQYDRLIKNKPRPRAVAGLYGACHYNDIVFFLYPDTSINLIWLMGGKDVATPASDCTEVLKKIKKLNKVKVSSHIYPNATHCWDCKTKRGLKDLGHGGVYVYDEKVTKDSEQRVLSFFGSFK